MMMNKKNNKINTGPVLVNDMRTPFPHLKNNRFFVQKVAQCSETLKNQFPKLQFLRYCHSKILE